MRSPKHNGLRPSAAIATASGAWNARSKISSHAVRPPGREVDGKFFSCLSRKRPLRQLSSGPVVLTLPPDSIRHSGIVSNCSGKRRPGDICNAVIQFDAAQLAAARDRRALCTQAAPDTAQGTGRPSTAAGGIPQCECFTCRSVNLTGASTTIFYLTGAEPPARSPAGRWSL